MKKSMVFLLCFAFLILTVTLASFAADAATEDVPLSYGIRVLAEGNGMAMAGLRGAPISFDADDFARAMNLSKIDSVTITEVPPLADGELLVGSTVVNAGQTISGKNLGFLSYDPKSDFTAVSYFRFKVGDSAYDVKCSLYMLEKTNHAPTLSVATETLLNVSTHKNITLYGSLPCYDPDGDPTRIEIVSYPKSGSIILDDSANGSYTYLPNEDYTGKDSFTYVAVDKYGNYSASKSVSLEVNKPKTAIVYADMLDSPAYNSALTVTEAGVMSGTQIGSKTYFYPKSTVTRAEFVVMAMNSIGISDVSDVSASDFYDEESIPQQMSGYVYTAHELGYISGSYVDSKLCFRPNDPITRAEAAVIVCNMIDAVTPTVTPIFEDSDEIPTFATSAVNSLNYMGVLRTENGNISAASPLTREDTAHLLSMMMRISK